MNRIIHDVFYVELYHPFFVNVAGFQNDFVCLVTIIVPYDGHENVDDVHDDHVDFHGNFSTNSHSNAMYTAVDCHVSPND